MEGDDRVQSYVEMFTKWIDEHDKNVHKIAFHELLKEWEKLREPIPVFNSDKYWDRICRIAKYDLRRYIDALFLGELIKDITNDWEPRVTWDESSMSVTRTYKTGFDPFQ